MNQRQLKAFRATMLLGSITAAAKELNVSQPAVSRLVSDLEFELGFALFTRHAGRVAPTLEAEEFFREVDMMFYSLDRLSQVADEIRTLSRATVRFATLPMLSFEVIPQAVKRFRQLHPRARLMQDVFTSARIVELVASRQVEIGVAQTHQRREDIDILSTHHARCVCAIEPSHPLAGAQRLSPEELRDEPLITLARHTISASYIANAFADRGIAPNIVAESQPSFAAASMAASGIGIAIVDQLSATVLGEKVAVVPFEPTIPFDICVMKSRDVPLSRAAEVLFAEIDAGIGTALQQTASPHQVL